MASSDTADQGDKHKAAIVDLHKTAKFHEQTAWIT
jgi:hypothetical protein